MIKDLLEPSSLPDITKEVRLIQTHISMVLVADNFVYKIKKPVDFGFLDFTDLEKRKFYCHQEVKLNSRLAEDIYLGVLPVIFDGKVHRIGMNHTGGEIVDYAVKMRRIPQDRLMKSLFQRGELTEEHLRKISLKLSTFHLNAERSPEIDHFGEPDAFRINTEENFEQTEKYIDITIKEKDYRHLSRWTDLFLKNKESLFRERISMQKIRDCHGDLHMEHVCLTDKVSVIDCIEFNDRFRYSDTIADIAFLLMDLEFHGGKEVADRLWSLYAEETGDSEMMELLTFYKVYRAYVRGKVNSFRLDDPNIPEGEKTRAIREASRYFELARSYVD